MARQYISGGDKLAAALQQISTKVATASVLRVGFLEDATYPDGKSVGMVATINEFGAPSRGQPPRPFFRNMIAAHADEWPEAIAQNLRATDYDGAKTLALVGEGIAAQLRQSIVDLVAPPLAKSTVQRKGFDKPLIDTSHMLNSIGTEVE